MKKKREITESKYPPVNNEDLWLKDGKLYHSTSQGWVPLSEEPSITETYEQGVSSISYSGKDGQEHLIELSENVESDVIDIINDTFTTNDDDNITFTDDDNIEHTLVTTDALPSILANNNMQEVTWLQLKNLRDNSQLTAGCLYRITDYENNTDVKFDGITSHQFDIVLLALSKNKLTEEGWAMMHDNVYDVTFADEVTKKCYIYEDIIAGYYYVVDIKTLLGVDMDNDPDVHELVINEETKTAVAEAYNSTDLTEENLPYNYFQNSNLSAWKIWYCLDNDKSRFTWADDSVDEGTPASITSSSNPYNIFYRDLSKDKTITFPIRLSIYGWTDDDDNTIYTGSTTPNVGDNVLAVTGAVQAGVSIASYTPAQESTGLENGRGVIYRLTDEEGDICKLQWNELKTIRDSKALVADTKYRIIDYQCTTTQENTQSAGHQFDIVLLALSANKLAEEGWAMITQANVYTVTFWDNVVAKCYIVKDSDSQYTIVSTDTLLGSTEVEVEVDEETKTAVYTGTFESLDTPGLKYDYFAECNLTAWKVWYCLDNDTARFAWADDASEESITINGVTFNRYPEQDAGGYYGWKHENSYVVFTGTLTPKIGDMAYVADGDGGYDEEDPITAVSGFGRGVIYQFIDEWNIDYPCDFKNMQMLVPMDSDDNIDIQNPVGAKYCYAFTDNTSGDPEDLSIKGHAIDIKVRPKLIEETYSATYFTPTTLFYTNHNEEQVCKFSHVTVGIADTTIFINRGNAINILDGSSNIILKDCGAICIGYNSSNIMLDTVVGSTFDSYCQNIQLVDEQDLNYGNSGVELATKNDIGDIETLLNNI